MSVETLGVELLSHDEDGRAIEGPKYPLDLHVIKWLDESDNQRLAYVHKFFRRDERGEPVLDSLVRFLVPDYLCDGPSPSRAALRLVAERMGWA